MIETIITIVILAIRLVSVTQLLQGTFLNSAEPSLQVRTTALAQAYLDEILSKRFDEKTRRSGIPPCRAPDGPGGVPTNRECTEDTPTNFLGPDGSETRTSFDDVDDYHGLDEGDGQVNPLQDAGGAEREGYENFRVQVDVRYLQVGASEDEEFTAAGATILDDKWDGKLITVTVSHRTQTAGFKFSAYKANF